MVYETTAGLGPACRRDAFSLPTFSFLFDDCRGGRRHGTHLVIARLVVVAFSLHAERCGDRDWAAEWSGGRCLTSCLFTRGLTFDPTIFLPVWFFERKKKMSAVPTPPAWKVRRCRRRWRLPRRVLTVG